MIHLAAARPLSIKEALCASLSIQNLRNSKITKQRHYMMVLTCTRGLLSDHLFVKVFSGPWIKDVNNQFHAFYIYQQLLLWDWRAMRTADRNGQQPDLHCCT